MSPDLKALRAAATTAVLKASTVENARFGQDILALIDAYERLEGGRLSEHCQRVLAVPDMPESFWEGLSLAYIGDHGYGDERGLCGSLRWSSEIGHAPDPDFGTPLDPGIEHAVRLLREAGVETFESCEGGPGHAFPEPTVRFGGDTAEGFKAFAAALDNGLPVVALKRVWRVSDHELKGPWWELTFTPTKGWWPA